MARAQGTEAEAVVIKHNSYIEWGHFEHEKVYKGDFYNVIGVIQVTGTKNIKDVGVDLTFYDAEGKRIVAGPILSMLGSYRIEDGTEIPNNLLGPGDKLPFHMVLLDEGASAKVASYDMTVKYVVTDEEPYRSLTILNSELWVHEYGYKTVTGELMNDGDKYVSSVSVYVAFYDASERIVRAVSYPAPMHILAPGQKIVFTTHTTPIEGDATYELTATCLETDYIPYSKFKVLSQTSHKDEYGYLVVEGEVGNIGDRDATMVIVATDFYDEESKPLGAFYEEIPEIRSGESSPFSVMFWDEELAAKVSNYTFHLSSLPYTRVSGPEASPIRATPSLQTASAAIAVGAGVTVGLTGVVSATGFGQQVNAAVSNLSIPDWVKDFVKFYAEETFKHLTREEAARRRRKLFSIGKLLSLAFSALVLLLVLSYVEVNGLPSFLDPASLLSVIPYVFVTVVLFFVAEVLFTFAIAATLDVWCEFRIWLYGLIALMVSGFGFLLPFGSPARTDYEGDLDERKAGLIATLKILCDLILMLPFYAFVFFGYKVIGDAGLLIATMSAYHSSFPFKPLEGEGMYRYSKPLWTTVFAGTFLLFISAALNLLPPVTYLFSGLLATILFTAILITVRRHGTIPSALPSMPQPLPPPPPAPPP